MTLRLTFGVLPWTLEDTDIRWHVSCQSPSDKLSLWSRIFLYFVCAQMLGYLLQVSSTSTRYQALRRKRDGNKEKKEKKKTTSTISLQQLTINLKYPTTLTTIYIAGTSQLLRSTRYQVSRRKRDGKSEKKNKENKNETKQTCAQGAGRGLRGQVCCLLVVRSVI